MIMDTKITDFNIKTYSPSKQNFCAKPVVSISSDTNIANYKGNNTTNGFKKVSPTFTNSTILDLDSFTMDDDYIDWSNYDVEKLKNSDHLISESKEEEATGAKKGGFFRSLVGSLVGSFLDLGEGFVDSHIYGTTKIINALYLDKAFGWKNGYDDNIIGYDVSGKVEDFIEGDAKNKTADGIGSFIGEMVGYGALNSIPYVGFLASIFAGAGKKTEKSINEQMEETGCVNDWNVFFKSLGGALEGFAFSRGWKAKNVIQNGGIKKVFSGAAKLSTSNLNTAGKGVVKAWNVGKKVVVNWIKTIPDVAKNAGLSALKDPKSWAQTGANIIDDAITVFQSKDFESWSHLIAPNGWKYFFDNLGYSGMSYLKDLVK